MGSLLTKYRPYSWETLIGHEEVVKSVRKAMGESSRPCAYLLTGPSGIGKTTIARIISKELEADYNEVDAATNSGVEAMRSLLEISSYVPMGASTRKMLTIDEAHMLSKQAWNSLLKILEEPPPHLFFALCTTEMGKVPETIQTRCFHIPLKPLRPDDIFDLLLLVCEMEGWKPSKEILEAVVDAATGQPRKALSILQAVHSLGDVSEVKRVVSIMDDDDGYLKLGRLLIEGAPWNRVKPVLQGLDYENVEQGLIGLGRYLGIIMVGEEKEEKAKKAWILLDALVYPSQSWDKKAVLLSAIGRMMFG